MSSCQRRLWHARVRHGGRRGRQRAVVATLCLLPRCLLTPAARCLLIPAARCLLCLLIPAARCLLCLLIPVALCLLLRSLIKAALSRNSSAA